MTKQEAHDFLARNPNAIAVNPDDGIELRITCDSYQHTGVITARRDYREPIANWLDNAFFANRSDGWGIEWPVELP